MNLATANPDRISLGQKSAYAVGMFVNNLQAAALPAMLVILNLGLGMDPVLVGMIGFVPRIFDALSDPVLGYVSDNTRTRWGRRRPYILFGALLSGFLFAAMWQLPAGHTEIFYFWAFMTMSSLYFIIYTLYATPFVALGFEMTSDYHERTRLHAFANIAGLLPWLGVPWFYKIMANEQLFDNKVDGARTLALWVGGSICLLGIVPVIFCREKFGPKTDTSDTTIELGKLKSFVRSFTGFFEGVNTTFKCRPFVKLCIATLLVVSGAQFSAFFSLYVMKYYVFHGNDVDAGTLNGSYGTLTAACTLFVIPLAGWMATRIGKRETFIFTISVSLIGYALKWVGYNPDHPNWLLFSCPFVAFGMGSLFTLMGSMTADVCDYDELESNQRRAGLFSAIYWWMVKLGMALAGLLAGIMLKASGFNVKLTVPQSEQTLLLLRVFDVVVPFVTSAIAIGIIATYQITETRAYEIRRQLEARQDSRNE